MPTSDNPAYYRPGMYELLQHPSIHGKGKKAKRAKNHRGVHGFGRLHGEKRRPDVYHNKGVAKGQF